MERLIVKRNSLNLFYIQDEGGTSVGAAKTWELARQFAASGEMLEALRMVREWLNRYGEHSPVYIGGEGQVAEAIEAAIMAATGEGGE